MCGLDKNRNNNRGGSTTLCELMELKCVNKRMTESKRKDSLLTNSINVEQEH